MPYAGTAKIILNNPFIIKDNTINSNSKEQP
jgi:hypothetical protein